MVAAGLLTAQVIMNQPAISSGPTKILKPNEGSISARSTRVEEVTADGRVKWVLESTDINGKITGSFDLTNPKASITLDDGSSLIMTSPGGHYDKPNSEVKLTGGVNVIRSDDQSSFTADEVIWNSKDLALVSGGDEIKLSRGNWHFSAGGIKVDLSGDKTVIDLDAPVKIIQVESEAK